MKFSRRIIKMSDMDEEQEWQPTCKVMKERGAVLRQFGQWADCTLLVGAGAESHPFKAHKLILSMASPVFESLLIGVDEQNNVLNIPDTDPEAFDSVLNYIYMEDININSFKLARDTYCLANKFMLLQLAHVCISYLSCNVTTENACEAYELGLLFNEKLLIDESVEVIKYNLKSVLSTTGFEQVHLDTVNKIFSIEGLLIDSELDLFHAAERYARAQKTGVKRSSLVHNAKRKLDTGDDENENIVRANKDDRKEAPASLHSISSQSESKVTCKSTTARTLLQHIRFLTLTAVQFAQIARSELLAEHESLALLVNILHPATDVPLPSGFCTSRESRYVPPPPQHKLSLSCTIRLRITPSHTLRQHSATSPPHLLLGQHCRLHMLPRYESCTSGNAYSMYLGFFLRWEIAPGSKWSCVASLRFCLLNSNPSHQKEKTLTGIKFDSANYEIGFDKFISKDELITSERGYLGADDDNALTIEVLIEAEECEPTETDTPSNP